MKEKEWVIFTVPCDCLAHELQVMHSRNKEECWGAGISIWCRGYNSWGIWEKLRHILTILKGEYPYSDTVILNKHTCNRLGEHLLKVAEEIPENSFDASEITERIG